MALEAPPSTEPKGLNPMRSIVAGLFPADMGAANADQVAEQNLARVQGKSRERTSSPANPPAPAKALPPASPQLKALEAFAGGNNPAPAEPAAEPGERPSFEVPAEAPPQPEPPVPVAEPEAPEAKIEGFDDELLAALDEKVPVKPAAEPKPEVPAADVVVEDPEAPVVIPKKAEEMQQALIKVSKELRAVKKENAQIKAKGSIDTAAAAVEPLQQQLQQKDQEIQHLRNIAASADLMQDPEIQRRYVQPLQMAEQFITDTAKANEGMSARDLFAAAGEADPAKRHAAVRAACSDLHPSDAIRVEQAVDALVTLSGDLSGIKQNAGKIKEIRQKEQQTQQIAQQAQWRAASIKAYDEVCTEAMENPVIAQFVKKNPELKKELEGAREMAKKAELETQWGSQHKTRAQTLFDSHALPVMRKAYEGTIRDLMKELKTEKAKNINLRAGTGLSSNPRSTYTPPPANDGKPQSTEQMVKSVLGSALRGG
jgi:hypothetical protein